MRKEKKIYIVAAILSLILYMAGVVTGIFTERHVSSSTLKEIEFLKQTMKYLQRDMENAQLQQLYISTIGGEEACSFLISSISQLEFELTDFWDKLPKRLEEFEKYEKTTESYQELKNDYTLVLLRTWMLSSDLREKCNKDVVPILYFYSKDCDECIDFGATLDRVKSDEETKGKDVMIFTVDMYMNTPIVNIIKDTYNITYAPSIIINKDVYKGVMSYDEIEKIIESS